MLSWVNTVQIHVYSGALFADFSRIHVYSVMHFPSLERSAVYTSEARVTPVYFSGVRGTRTRDPLEYSGDGD